MDEKLKQALNDLLDKLTDEQKEQAKSCKTLNELTEFLGTIGVELPDELLDAVSGGVLGDSHKFGIDIWESFGRAPSHPQLPDLPGGPLAYPVLEDFRSNPVAEDFCNDEEYCGTVKI